MRRRDRIKVIKEANQRLETTYLKSKGFLKEDGATQVAGSRPPDTDTKPPTAGSNADTLLKNKGVQSISKSLASDPEKLNKAVQELISLGVGKEVLLRAAEMVKNGEYIDSLIKSEIKTDIKEVEDIETDENELWRKKQHEKIKSGAEWSDLENYITGFGDEEVVVGGIKLGAVLGSVLGYLVDSGLILTTHRIDPKELLIVLSAVVVGSMVMGGVTGWKANKDIKKTFGDKKY